MKAGRYIARQRGISESSKGRLMETIKHNPAVVLRALASLTAADLKALKWVSRSLLTSMSPFC